MHFDTQFPTGVCQNANIHISMDGFVTWRVSDVSLSIFGTNDAHVLQESGCAGHAKCMKKSSVQRALLSPRSAPLGGRCREGSCKRAPKLRNVPSALSGKEPSGAPLMAKPGSMRYACTHIG